MSTMIMRRHAELTQHENNAAAVQQMLYQQNQSFSGNVAKQGVNKARPE